MFPQSKQLNLTSARSSADGSHTVATLGDENPYSNEPLLPSPTHMKSFTAPHPSTVVVIGESVYPMPNVAAKIKISILEWYC